MSLNRKLFSKSASAAAVCNSESLAPFGNEASYNKNVALYQFDNSLDDGVGSADGTGSGGFSYSTTHKFGSHSLALDGTDGKVSLGNQTWFNSGDYSVSMWIRNEGNDSAYQTLISKRDGADAGSPINLHMYGVSMTDGGKLYASFGGSSYFKTTTVLSKNTWYHIVYTVVAGGAMKIYIDGVLDGTQATEASGTRATNSIDLAIGTNGSNTDYPFNGKIDQVRIYSGKALSQEEVTTLYLDETDATASTTTIIPGTSCVAYYPLDYDAQDKSGNFNGTATSVDFVQNGKINYAARFNGSSSTIDMADNIFQYSASSVSMWFWGPPSTSGWNVLYNNSGYKNTLRFLGIDLFCANDKVAVYMSNTSVGTDATYTMSASYNIGAWNFIAMTVDTTNHLKLYLNGAAAESFTTGGYGFDNSYPMNVTIGVRKSGQDSCTSGCEWFPGLIDEVRIFNKILSSDEVTTLYGLTACTQTCTTDTADFVATNTAYYKLDGDATDYHGGTYDGTASNLTYASGRFGSAADFTNSGKIDTGYTANDSAFSISTWVKYTGSPSSEYNYIASKGFYSSSSSTNYFQLVSYNEQYPRLQIRLNNTSNVSAVSSVGVTSNTWYHIAATCDSSGNLKIYLNGSETGSGSGAPARSMGQVMYIGSYFDGSWASGFFKGLIDNFRYFSSALTDTNVQDLYDTEFQCYITKDATDPFADSSEKAFYKFEENTGTSLTDSSGNGNNGTIDGMTWTTTNPAFGSYSGSFDGTNDKVDLPDNILPDNSTAGSSASIWFKHAAWTGGETTSQCILDSWDYDNSHPAWSLFIEPDASTGRGDGHIYLANYYLGGGAITSGSFHYDDGNWHHAVVVFDQSENKLKLYMDGVLFGTETTTASNVWIFTEKSAIGYQNAHPSHPRYFNGQTDQCRIFNRVLTGGEVWKLYAERNN